MLSNKVIAVFLSVMMLISSVEADPLLEKSQSTKAGKWKDANSGIVYHNFGSVSFKFGHTKQRFAPWAKFKAPSMNAGCGGISLNAGFAGFMGLDEIGKQLSTAISAVGMGVIVVLIQTLPSIGKAFENIQKLIRKIQSMLQNACQLTTTALSNLDAVKDAKRSMQSAVDEKAGVNWMNNTMGGAVDFMNDAEAALKCTGSDTKCKFHKNSIFFKTQQDDKATAALKDRLLATPKFISTAIQSSLNDKSIGCKSDKIMTILDSKNFGGKSITLSAKAITNYKLVTAIFGLLVVDRKNTTLASNVIDETCEVNIKKMAAATDEAAPPPSYLVERIAPINSVTNIVNFLSGDNLTSSTETNSLEFDPNYDYEVIVYCTKSKKDTGCEAGINTIQWIERNGGNDGMEYISWSGIYQATYASIMHELDRINPAPTTPISVFMPRGVEYLRIIKRYANKSDWSAYADLLAKMNVRYAVKGLMQEAITIASEVNTDANPNNMEIFANYVDFVRERTRLIESKIPLDSKEVAYLNNLQKLFTNIKTTSKEKRTLGLQK